MQQVLSSTSKVMMDYKGAGNLLYLPLDKLLQQAGTSTAADTLPSGRPGQVEPAQSDAGPRSRDTLRGRERGER